MARHKHADVIIAWAQGEKIQVQNHLGRWINIPDSIETPSFSSKLKYRITPKLSVLFRPILSNGDIGVPIHDLKADLSKKYGALAVVGVLKMTKEGEKVIAVEVVE